MTTDDFLTAWLAHHGDPAAVMEHLNITPTRLLALVAEHRAALDALHELRIRRAQAQALEHQLAAAEQLRRTLAQTTDPIQRRHAATTLGRIAHQIQRAPAPQARPAPLPSRGTQAPRAPLPIPPQRPTNPSTPAPSIAKPAHSPAAALTQAAGAQRARAG